MGLGFDPTENMGSLIQSPSTRPDSGAMTHLEGLDFGSLGLAPPPNGEKFSNSGNSSNRHNHIFAFGTSGPWGTGGDANDWGAGLLGGRNAKPASASRLFGSVLSASSPDGIVGEPSSLDGDNEAFLSLATAGATWTGAGAPAAIPSFVGGDGSIANDRGSGGGD